MIGKNIRQLRVSANFTQEEMAKTLNLKKNDIANWELERNNPKIESAIIIAKYFKVSLDDLYLKDLEIENSSTNSVLERRDYAEVPEEYKDVKSLYELFDRLHRIEDLMNQSEERAAAQVRQLEAKLEANSKLMWAAMDKIAERTQKMYQLLGAITAPAGSAAKVAEPAQHRSK